MRIAQLSDIHYCDKYLEEVDRCMSAAVDVLSVIRPEPDLIVLSGDTFDHRLEQNSPALLTALRRVSDLADIAPVLILQGTLSHDAPHAIDVFRHIKALCPVYVADRIEQVVLSFNDDMPPLFNRVDFAEDGRLIRGDMVLISCLPSVNKAQVAAAVGAENAAHAVGDHIAALLAGWGASHEAARAAGVPTIVVSHGTVSGSLTEHGVPMAGLDHEYTAGSLFAAKASAVMLGHIHKHQAWTNWLGETGVARLIAYPGSLARLHFGEYDPKGFLLWDVQAQGATFEFIALPARELYEIEFPGAPDMAALAEHRAKVPAGAYVRIRYALDEEHRNSADKEAIIQLFEHHAAEVKIEARILPVQRQRAAGIGAAPSLAEKLSQWCALTGTDGDTTDELQDRLRAVQYRTPDQIAEGFA